MKKVLRNSIIGFIILVLTLGLGIGLGVAANDSSKNIQFNLGLEYTPKFDVKVYMLTDLGSDGVASEGDLSTKIFDTFSPVGLENMYISSISSNTLCLNTENLKLINHETDGTKHIYFQFVTEGDKKLTATLSCGAATATANFENGVSSFQSISTGISTTATEPDLGGLIINLQFEEKAFCTATFKVSFTGGTLWYKIHANGIELFNGSLTYSVGMHTYEFEQGSTIYVKIACNDAFLNSSSGGSVPGKDFVPSMSFKGALTGTDFGYSGEQSEIEFEGNVSESFEIDAIAAA